MKIIDEKGKLFGKINLIDFLVILFLFFFASMFYFSFKLFSKKTEGPREFIDTEVTCNLIKVKPEILKLIKVGDKEIDEDTGKIGEIILIGDDKPYEYKVDLGAGETRVIKDITLREIPVRMQLRVEVKENNTLYYKNNQIIINSPFYFKSNKYMVKAIPVSIGKEELVQVKVKFSNVPVELSDLVKAGDTENDNSGKTLGKIIKIISNTPIKAPTIKLDENRIVFLDLPYYNDIVVLLDILCNYKEGNLYFKNYLVKAGSNIDFMTDLYSISGTIIGLEIK